MARKRKAGDTATNARKRYYRQSERYIKQSENASGSVKQRLLTLARNAFNKALETYSSATRQAPSKPIQKLAEFFNVDISAQRQGFSGMTRKGRERAEKRRLSAISESQNYIGLQNQPEEERRQAEAWAIFNTPGIGRRIMGGFVDVWSDAAFEGYDEYGKPQYSPEKMVKALYEHMGVDNMADLLEKLEEKIGKSLYSDLANENIYETVKLTIANMVASGELIAA